MNGYVRTSHDFTAPGAVEVDEHTIGMWVSEVEDSLEGGEEFALTSSGRAIVIGFKSEDGYRIIVVRDGYEEITHEKR